MRLTEFRSALPCQPSQAISVYLYCLNRYIAEHLSNVDISLAAASPGKIRLRRAYQLAPSVLPAWAQLIIPNGVRAFETCDVDVKNGTLVSTIKCPMLDDRLFMSLESQFHTEKNLPNAFSLSKSELRRRRLVSGAETSNATAFMYKLARVRFRQFGLQSKIEDFLDSMIVEVTKRVLMKVADWQDQWSAFTDTSLGSNIIYTRPPNILSRL